MTTKFIASCLSMALLLAMVPFTASAQSSARFENTIASANGRAYAIQKDGSLWYWGKRSFNDTVGDQSPDRARTTKLLDDVIGVYGDFWSGFAIKKDHSMWSFDDKGHAVKVMDGVKEVASSYTKFVALRTDGTVWIGYAHGDPELKQMTSLSGAKHVSAGYDAYYAVKEDGTLWGWGENYMGQLGVETPDSYVFIPVLIMNQVDKVHGAGQSAFAIKQDGSLWGWGENDDDIIYNTSGDETGAFDPFDASHVVVPLFTPLKLMDNVEAIEGRSHIAVIKKDHTLWLWGNNEEGQLGDGTTISRNTPRQVMDDVAAVTAGGAFTLVLKTNGTLWGFGTNGAGELALGSFDFDPHPSPIQLMRNVAAAGPDNAYPSSWTKGDWLHEHPLR